MPSLTNATSVEVDPTATTVVARRTPLGRASRPAGFGAIRGIRTPWG
jgi:hypothetical protein